MSGDPGAAAAMELQPQLARPFDSYSLRDWRRIEHQNWARRRVPLSAKKPARSSDQFRRGEYGPMHHWRRGLVGALQDRAVCNNIRLGSRIDQAALINLN